MQIKKKKGLIDSIWFIVIGFFIYLIISLLGAYMWYSANSTIQSMNETTIGNHIKAKIEQRGNALMKLPNYFSVFVFLSLFIALIYTSLTINPEHPAFFVKFLIFTFIISGGSALLQNIGARIFNFSLINPVATQQTVIYFFLKNYHWFGFMICLISGVIFYIRSQQFTGGSIE